MREDLGMNLQNCDNIKVSHECRYLQINPSLKNVLCAVKLKDAPGIQYYHVFQRMLAVDARYSHSH